MADLIFSGFGGQGTLTAGLIVAKTGMENDRHVSWIPSYGSEMRGGTANCNVKVSDEKIGSPFVKEIDVLVAMNTPSLDKFAKAVRPGGIIVANESLSKNYVYPKGVKVFVVEANSIAKRLENARGVNITMLGALAKSWPEMPVAMLKKGINTFFDEKGQSNPKNDACFDAGAAEVREVQ